MNNVNWVLVITVGIILIGAAIGAYKGLIRMVVSVLCFAITLLLVWAVQPYVREYVKDNTPLYQEVNKQCSSYIQREISKQVDANIMSNPWAKMFDGYIKLGEKGVANSIGGAIAGIVVNIIAFLGTFAVISILVKVFFIIFKFAARLPVIHTLNRSSGMILGAFMGLLLVWILMLVAVAFFYTSAGVYVLDGVQKSQIVRLVYENNPLIGFVGN